jgi:hypothetical protein
MAHFSGQRQQDARQYSSRLSAAAAGAALDNTVITEDLAQMAATLRSPGQL